MEIRVGILQCDHVADGLIKDHGDYQNMFTDLIQSEDADIEISVYDLTNDQFPIDLKACDGYLITGSKFSVFDDIPWIHKAKSLVRELYKAHIPTIGICFGHQLIAEALGGKVDRATDKGWGVGVHEWQVKNQQQWMNKKPLESISMRASHQDQVIRMPEDATLIAGSNFCPIAGFQMNSMVTFQGHPEFSKEYLLDLIENRLDRIDQKTAHSAIKSLANAVDAKTVATWMVDFIKNSRA
jgi:GMP synthase-like glutamine amidotransferase